MTIRRSMTIRSSVIPSPPPKGNPAAGLADGSSSQARRSATQAALRTVRDIRGRYLLAIDLIGIVFAAYLALALGMDEIEGPKEIPAFPFIVLLLLSVRTGVNILLGLYSRRWRFASVPELARIVGAATLGSHRRHRHLLRDRRDQW